MCALDLRQKAMASSPMASAASITDNEDVFSFETTDSSRSFVRQIYENALFSDAEIDEALLQVINEFKLLKPATYEFFLQSAKKSHIIRAAWKLVLIDTLIGIEFARQTEDEAFYLDTLSSLFPGRRVPGGEAILDAVIERYGHEIPAGRLRPLQDAILSAGCAIL